MPETIEARQRVLDYKDENKISYEQLAIMTGYSKPEIHKALTGKSQTPYSNKIILKLIQMFGLA
ncbi:XRE family transcriptional regulator [Facklamia sp. 7083-14-GEN3]|uniref:XRE family transcriptional regulator n=1 Tax=Facklamia sp. 7083-14-GEN3 TaxID=2973478 RepID=UPI00215C8091|nr:XRE family transcriptional regulator [Facklamia sp. 7083-14-GEN3]MCR8969303.1 XRE family transcriptional regulator [Facklamia sp. 7083-14-GEN3]